MSLRHFLKHTSAGRVLLIPYRLFVIAMPRLFIQFGQMCRWALTSKEHYNHSYDLAPLNRDYLVGTVAVVTGLPYDAVDLLIKELETDLQLRSLLRARALTGPDRHNSDPEPRYGRRLAWYALVRATRPRVVLETGVDRGLGTVVLAAAVKRNAEEGFPGMVYATDINPQCGHLLAVPYTEHVRVLLGDSVALIKDLDQSVDIFLHDSDHRPEYEWAEFLAVEPKLHADALVLSDNASQTSMLLNFSKRLGKHFLYFQDQPRDHWWPGDGLGVAYGPGPCLPFQGAVQSAAGREPQREVKA